MPAPETPIARFFLQFPEFDGVEMSLIQAHLDAAALEIDEDVWRAKAEQGRFYLAAHKLALSPFGQNARMVAKDGTTTYYTHYRTLVGQVAHGFRVV